MGTRVEITDGNFTATISNVGAELKSVIHLNSKTEFMWQADQDIWPRTAPVLFPIVGKVKNDLLRAQGKTFPLTQHGFARDMTFAMVEQTTSKVVYQLIYSDATLQKYPYDFKLLLSYEWVSGELICGYEVHNLGVVDMPFSIGAHPGFALPGMQMSDWKLIFNKPETLSRHLLSDGLFDHTSEAVMHQTNELPLRLELFDKDAIVFKHMNSTEVKLINLSETHSVNMRFEGFPYFGIWTKKGNQRFVCLEPWFGHSDYTEGHEDITKKEGMQMLPSHQVFKASYALTFSKS